MRPPEDALLEQIANGCLHPSLIAEPNGNGNGRVVGIVDVPVEGFGILELRPIEPA